MNSMTTTRSGLAVPASAVENKPKVRRSHGMLVRAFFETLPRQQPGKEFDTTAAAFALEECKAIVNEMRAMAHEAYSCANLRDAQTLTDELRLHIGALKRYETGGRKIYTPSDV